MSPDHQTARAAGILLGYLADRVLADPRRGHPVAGFGRAAARLERLLYADSRARGATYAGILVGSSLAVGVAVERASRRHPLASVAATAGATWAVLGGTTLEREAQAVQAHLAAGALPAARQRLTHLVGRETSRLDEPEIARAVIESVAENSSDAVVAPLLWGALLGVPGMLGYRAANTLDAMVGHRSARYARFGWAAARLDDLLNLPAARLSALLAAGAARTVGGSSRRSLRVWRRDGRHHPSPNAGPVEAAFAGALDLTLGGVNDYAGRVEDRHTLGDGPAPSGHDIERAVVLARRVSAAAVVAAAVIGAARRAPRPGR